MDYSAKSVTRCCPFDYETKILTGRNLPPGDTVTKSFCEKSSQCTIEPCPIAEAYNNITMLK